MQVEVPGIMGRESHSATACSLSSGLVEVVVFGGTYGRGPMADTTVLRFGEYVVSAHAMISHYRGRAIHKGIGKSS